MKSMALRSSRASPGVTRDGTEGSFTYRDDDWTLRGALIFTGGELVLQA